MAQNNSKTMRETLVEMVKPYIPKEIVMTPIAYKKPLNQEKTIENFKSKVKTDFIKDNPRYTYDLLEQIDSDLEYIISCRILVGSSTPQ